jgi:hypothetical protein
MIEMIDQQELTLTELERFTLRPCPVELVSSCEALAVALVEVEEAVAWLAHRPCTAAVRRVNCAWACALRRHRVFVRELRFGRTPA